MMQRFSTLTGKEPIIIENYQHFQGVCENSTIPIVKDTQPKTDEVVIASQMKDLIKEVIRLFLIRWKVLSSPLTHANIYSHIIDRMRMSVSYSHQHFDGKRNPHQHIV